MERLCLWVAVLLVIYVSLLECTASNGYITNWQILCLTALLWLTSVASLLAISARWSVVGLVCATCVPFAMIEAILLTRYGAPLNSHSLNIMLATDYIEARQYLTTLAPAAAICLLLTVLALRAAWRIRSTIAVLERINLVLAAGAGWLCVTILLWIWTPAVHESYNDVVSPTARLVERAWPFGLPIRWVSFVRERARMRTYAERSAAFRFGTSTSAQARVVVLVIGESSRASSWQLGGYMRPTNPRLAARSDVVWLANYAANGVATSVSVPLMITRMPVEQLGGGWAERSILSAFAEAGFTTSWISNQATAGMHDVQIANYAREASNVKFINWVNHELRGTYDSQLFKPLKAQLATGVDLQLIVLHLMGSHHVYSERYPPEQSYFGPNISDNLDNEYDDSIRHTDALLADVIETLEQTGKPAALLYASDHGELLRTSACSMQWHGFPTYENVFASAAVWLSSHPENAAFARALRLNAKLATQGKDLFDSMIEIGSLQGLKTLNSWFNIQYSTRTRSVMTMDGVIDADAKPHGACRLLTSQDP